MSRACRLSEDEYRDLVAKVRAKGLPVPDGAVPAAPPKKSGLTLLPLIPSRPVPIVDKDGMNKTERAFFIRLCAEADVVRVRFQALKFKLGKNCWHTPDFDVLCLGGRREIWEVKGHWEDDARVKIKACAASFPDYDWYAVQGRLRKTMATCWDVETIFCATGMPRPVVMYERRDEAPAH